MIEKEVLLEQLVNVLKEDGDGELLGFAYFEAMLPKLGWDKKLFVEKLQIYLEEDLCVRKEKPFFDFLIEVVSPTFNLYKWGQLLFSVDETHYGHAIMTITLKEEERFTILTELEHYFSFTNTELDEKGIAMVDISDNSVIYAPPSETKSAILSCMLELYKKEGVGIAIVNIDEYSNQYAGSYLMYDEARVKNDMAYINYIRKEFHTFKGRLEELQSLFKSF